MENIKRIVAHNIAQLRREKGITQADLAEELSYTDKAVSKWERGESIPDVAVLKRLADYFSVTVDYLLSEEHDLTQMKHKANRRVLENRAFITGIGIVLVVLVATLAFVLLNIILGSVMMFWLVFVYAVPISLIVWLIFNSAWFNKRVNFLIISFLMWSVLISVFLTGLAFGQNYWLIFVLGVPGQAIILMWSRIRTKKMSQEN